MEVPYKRSTAIIITTVAGINFLNVMGSGILTVALPTIAEGLGLSTELLLSVARMHPIVTADKVIFYQDLDRKPSPVLQVV